MADALLVAHAAFVAFVAVGGFAVLWRQRMAWLHLPALAWGAFVIGTGRICPLTPLENAWRYSAGQQGYEGGFIDHYVTAFIYPAGLTRGTQIALAIAVVVVNAGVYGMAWRRRVRDRG